jgi:AmmeMemoRadiSam system protein A
MAPSPSPEPLADGDLELLVDIADDSLVSALTGRPFEPAPPHSLPESLRDARGAFVTLTVDGELNGCIGDVVGRQPLTEAAARLALAAAFDDPRLPALRADQYTRLTIEVSVLSPFTAIAARDRAELVASLRPGVDGVLIRAEHRSGLFLPDVWAQLPDPDSFLDQLWRKAGVPVWMWPDTILQFTTQRLSRPAGRAGRTGEIRPDRVSGRVVGPGR